MKSTGFLALFVFCFVLFRLIHSGPVQQVFEEKEVWKFATFNTKFLEESSLFLT